MENTLIDIDYIEQLLNDLRKCGDGGGCIRCTRRLGGYGCVGRIIRDSVRVIETMLGMQNWNLISDPPKPYKDLILFNGKDMVTGYMHSDKSFTANCAMRFHSPTHWMYAPHPPKEDVE